MHFNPHFLNLLARQADQPTTSTTDTPPPPPPTSSSVPRSFYFAATVLVLLLVGYSIARVISFLLKSRFSRQTNNPNVSVRQRHSFFQPHHDNFDQLSNTSFVVEYEVPATPPPVHRQRFDPKNLVSTQLSDQQKQQACVICLEPYGNLPVSSGKCNHVMHTDCLTDWLQKDIYSTCPICRQCYFDKTDAISEQEDECNQPDTLEDLVIPIVNSPNTAHNEITSVAATADDAEIATRDSCEIPLNSHQTSSVSVS